nr:PREDICTED: XK-related protein 4 [Bos mutus]
MGFKLGKEKGNSPLDRGGGVSSGLRHSSPAGRAPLPTAAAPPLSPQSPEQPPGVRRSRSHLAARSFPESAGSGFPADPPVLRAFAGSLGPGTPTAAVGFQGPGVRIEPILPTLVGPGCTPSPSPDLRSSELNTKSPAPCHTRRPHSPPTSARAARGDPSSLRALPPLPGRFPAAAPPPGPSSSLAPPEQPGRERRQLEEKDEVILSLGVSWWSGSNSSGAARAGGKPRSASCSFCIWLLQSLTHILQLGQFWRYFHTIYLGIRSRQSGENDRWRFYWKMVYEYADVSMLHLLATFLESAPQLVLQLCIIVQTHSLQALQGFTAAASLVSLAWALASYQKALRDSRDDKKPISYMAVVIQFCWHFFTIAARVITFALFASVFQLYFGIFIVLHWCIMTFWIVHCETEFCITKWEEIVFDMVVGIIYIFSWFNVKEGRTRCRLFIYYFVILLENTALSALWYLYKAPQIADAFAIPALCVVFSSFLTGVVFMLMYYAFFHPNGPRFGQSPSCACEDPSAAFALPPDVATSTLRSISNNRSVAGDRDQKFAERDGCVPVFQVRPTAPSTPSSRPPRIEESVIKIDLFRNRYPAWERHVLDRSLRKAILAFECSPSPPRLQYKDDALIQERLEYETTL